MTLDNGTLFTGPTASPATAKGEDSFFFVFRFIIDDSESIILTSDSAILSIGLDVASIILAAKTASKLEVAVLIE